MRLLLPVNMLIVAAALLFLTTGFAQAQFQKKDVIVAMDYSVSSTLEGSRAVGGLNIQYFVGDRISLNYPITGSGRSVHMPAAVPLALLAIVYGGLYDPAALYLFLVPDGLSYHYPLNDNVTLSPYFNVLGADYFFDDESLNPQSHQAGWYWSGSIGSRVNLFLGESVMVGGFAEFSQSYLIAPESYIRDSNPSISGIRVGGSLGFRFN